MVYQTEFTEKNTFFSTEHDEFLDEANSILLNDVTRGIPVVNLVQVREKKLGKPYSGKFLITKTSFFASWIEFLPLFSA